MNYLERPSHTRLNNQRSNTKDSLDHSIDHNIRQSNSVIANRSVNKTKTMVSSLTGLPMKVSDFTHNNMVPFFGGSIKQNMDLNANSSRLESHTGVQNHRLKKEEIKPMFQPSRNISHVHGTPHQLENKLDRYIPSQMRTSETPIKKIMVGPGINSGYDWKPTGGLNQDKVRDVMMPKTVDQLRTVNNPKVSYGGRIISGKSTVDKRTSIAKIEKRAPDRYYKNDPSRYNTTVGAVTKQTSRAKPVVKDTGRKVSRPLIGAAGPAQTKKNPQRPCIQASNKIEYKQDSTRNLGASGQRVSDYGKSGHWAPPNEREVTETRTHTSNLTNVVKALIAPVQDLFRTTRKETVNDIENFGNIDGAYKKQTVYDPNDTTRTTIKETNIHNQVTGSMGVQAPPKITVYDKNDIMRTTIKETNIHNTRDGNLAGPKRLTLYDPNDIARTTIKETNIHNNRDGNLATGHQKLPVYDPNDIARTTIKETNIHNTRDGNLATGHQKQPAYDPNDIARTTVKETNIHNTRDGNLQGQTKQPAYDPNDVARTTVKETNIHDTRTGNLHGNKKAHVYDPEEIARVTVRNTLPEEDHNLNLQGMKKHQVNDPDQVAKTTIRETTENNNYDGQVEAKQRSDGYLVKKVCAKTTNRATTDDYEYSGVADGDVQGGGGQGYLTANPTAPLTNRQFTSDKEYSGTAKGDSKPVSYDNIYNATLNELRELTLEGREPTKSNNKVTVGSENVQIDIKKMEDDIINHREINKTAIINTIPDVSNMGEMTEYFNLDNDKLADRTDPDLIKAFKDNPYTHSLNSH